MPAVQVGTRVVVQPGGHAGAVRSVEVDGVPVALARAGDTADVTLSGIDAAALAAGAVVCHPGWPAPLAARLEARVVVLDVPMPILAGRQVSDMICSLPDSASEGLHLMANAEHCAAPVL